MNDYDFKQVNNPETVQKLVRVIDASSKTKRMVRGIIADFGMILDHHFCYCDRDPQQNQNVYVSRHSRNILRFIPLCRSQFVCGEVAETLLSCSGMKLGGHKILTPETSGGYFLGLAVSRLIKAGNLDHITIRMNEIERIVVENRDQRFLDGTIIFGNEVVVINDVDRTGSTLERLIKIIRQFKGEVNKVLVFATWNYEDFRKRMAALGVMGQALIEFRAKSWIKEDCPECRQNNRDEYRELIPASEMS
ncbi:MAG: phosphoribosyltransferase [Patescibacteria group bacterium]